MPIFFNGTDQERDELLAILARNCECKGQEKCSAHRMLDSQRALDGLVFARNMAERLLVEECTE